jgi:hypothetical protein
MFERFHRHPIRIVIGRTRFSRPLKDGHVALERRQCFGETRLFSALPGELVVQRSAA